MSKKQIKAFLEKVEDEANIQEKLKDAADADAALKIALMGLCVPGKTFNQCNLVQ